MTTAATKCVLLRFGDNDFRKTLLAFADVISKHRDVYAEGFLTKVKVAELWNALAPTLYALAQNGGHHTDDEGDISRIASYLKLDASAVFLDGEAVDHMVENQQQWNGSWIYIGLDGTVNTLV